MTKKIPDSEMIVIAMLKRMRKEKHKLILSAPTLPITGTQKLPRGALKSPRAVLSERGGEQC